MIPTGGGKTPIIATVCRDAVVKLNRRVLVLTHVKELVQQAEEKIKAIEPRLPVGIYSAGIGRKELDKPCTIAGIQSIYRKACDLGKVDLILVDEAHLIPPKGEGMYRQFFDDARTVNPKVRIAGLTATPYRLGTGELCHEEGILNEVCYEVGVRQLIDDGYLCPLKSRAGVAKVDTASLSVQRGEFVAGEMQAAYDDVVEAAVFEVLELTANRKSVLVFAAGVEHGQHVAERIAAADVGAVRFVDANTPTEERDRTVAEFKAGAIRYLVNVGIFTTGFDAPQVDCVVLLRATMSPGLYYQMVGRGFRIHPNKSDCLILDYGDNVTRHGPVDAIVVKKKGGGGGPSPAKECPVCHAVVPAAVRVCDDCGNQFPAPEENERHNARAGGEAVLSGEVTYETVDVDWVSYSIHTKKNAPDAPPTMRVDYHYGYHQRVSEWVCFEHDGFARRKAVQWWTKRSGIEPPSTVAQAVEWCNRGAVCDTKQVIVKQVAGNQFAELRSFVLGEIPEYREPGWDEPDDTPYTGPAFDEDDIPF